VSESVNVPTVQTVVPGIDAATATAAFSWTSFAVSPLAHT
jgi:hypothetical protein